MRDRLRENSGRRGVDGKRKSERRRETESCVNEKCNTYLKEKSE